MRNRFALLVETHSWKDYPRRVRITHNILVAARGDDGEARQGVAHGRTRSRLRAASVWADRTWRSTSKSARTRRRIDFRGYAYTREPSADLGRACDALRPDEAAGVAPARFATRSFRSSPCRPRAARTSCPRRTPHGSASASPCTASASIGWTRRSPPRAWKPSARRKSRSARPPSKATPRPRSRAHGPPRSATFLPARSSCRSRNRRRAWS